MSDEDDDTRAVRREIPDDATRVVERGVPDDATRVVERGTPDDATRVVRRDIPDDPTRMVQRPRTDDSTIVANQPAPPSVPSTAPPLLRGGRASFTPGGVSEQPAERYAARGNFTPEPVRRFPTDASSDRVRPLPTRQSSPRSHRTRVLVVFIATAVVVVALLSTVAVLIVRAL